MTKWEQLIAARERKHFSQMEAAEHLNVGLVTYQRWETGKRKPQPQHMRRLCERFGILLPSDESRSPLDNEPSPSDGAISSSLTRAGDAAPLEKPLGVSIDDANELNAYLTANMSSHLLSLAFMEHPTWNDKRSAIRQAIEEFDTMDLTDKNYQTTRREALCLLATLPIITLGLTKPEQIALPSTHYGSALTSCAASLEACWELGKSREAKDILLAFQSASKYQQVLETIARGAPSYREAALDLATRYALMKTILGRHCVGPSEAIEYAKSALLLSKETNNVSLQLSAYSKLAGTFFFGKRYLLAEKTAQEAEACLQASLRTSFAGPLHPCVVGGTYSTLALMQAKNGRLADTTLKKALDIDPGTESQMSIFMDFKRSSLMLDAGWIYCYQGDQLSAMKALEQRIDPETLLPKIPQSELGRLETIDAMALSFLRTKDRDLERASYLWRAEIEGAKAIKSELLFMMALATYELMEVAFPGERRLSDLRDHIVHWQEETE